ncbi:MAG: type II toxin-antitoxin system HipA family toxin [Bacteroidales bacterium]|nr:type II toxin-antitoxin system HipA family toxin [Bacteroidales bacterium]
MATRSKDIQTLAVSLWGVNIGTLQWNPRTRSSLFWLSPDYFTAGYDIAPISHPKAQQSPAIAIPGINDPKIYQGLPAFLADSLPDRWGNAVFDAWFKEEGLHEKDKTPLTKLSFIGRRAMGALEFYPVLDSGFHDNEQVRIDRLYEQAKLIEQQLAGKSIPVGEPLTRRALTAIGTSAGGRQMKAIIAIAPDGTIRSGQIDANPEMEHCIIKFNTPEHALSETEMTWFQMARQCGITMMDSRLIEVEGTKHFLTRRFDRKDGKKLFVQTLAAVDPDAHSYEDMFRTCRELEIPKPEIDELFKRAAFNVLTNNTDDHEKNFSFLMSPEGQWHLAPAYDMTFIIATNGIEAEKMHCMSIGGKYTDIGIEDLIRLGRDNAVKNPEEMIDCVLKSAENFESLVAGNGVDSFHIELIAKRLNELRPEGHKLLIPAQEPLSYVTEDGRTVSNIRFERTRKGNIHLLATIDGKEVKHVFSPKDKAGQAILEAGFNRMPEGKKRELVETYLRGTL